jgi:predicted HTH transcriptional regulator
MIEGVVIERHPDRLYFSNPGTMLISPEDFLEGGHGICRNGILQKMFIAIGRGEHMGSGADTINKVGKSMTGLILKSRNISVRTMIESSSLCG